MISLNKSLISTFLACIVAIALNQIFFHFFGVAEATFGFLALPFYTPLIFSLVVFGFLELNQFNKPMHYSILTFVMITISLAPYWLQIMYIPTDDSLREFDAVNYMMKNNTLHGTYTKYGYQGYTFHPGFRYLLGIFLLIFKEPYRLISILLQFGYLLNMLFCLRVFKTALSKRNYNYLLYFTMLSAAAVTNLINHYLTEWVIIAMAMSAGALYIKNHLRTCLIILALIPFFRQNLLPASIFCMAGIFFLNKKNNFLLVSIILVLLLLLPLIHNIYYARSFNYMIIYPTLEGITPYPVNPFDINAFLKNFFTE